MKARIHKFLWIFRNKLLTYHDDFDDAHTQRRLEKLDRIVLPAIEAATGDDVYILRGLAHFRAQMMVRTWGSLVVSELISLAVLPARLLRDAMRRQGGQQPRFKQHAYIMLPNRDTERRAHIYKLPAEMQDKDVGKAYVSPATALTKGDWAILKRLAVNAVRTRCPWPVQYLYKAYKDLVFSRSYMNAYPEAKIGIASQEYSCSLSLLTLQHHKDSRKLMNVMHGDNAASVLESYFIVDEFYCWAPFYADLFRRQRAKAMFTIVPNPDLVLAPGEVVASDGIAVLVPMLNFLPERFETLNDLIESYAVNVTKALRGKTASVRAHPAYPWTLPVFLNAAGTAYDVSDPHLEKPHDFVLRHRVLIGFYSTVLLEAASLGCTVVLVRYPASDSRAKYHYIFDMPNVHHVSLDDLPDFMAYLMTNEDAKGRGYGS